MNRLNNKIIIVTGGSGLLGTEIVKAIRAEGGVCINAEKNIVTLPDLSETQCDITNEESVNNLFKLVYNKYGRIDGLVNNAYPRTDDWGEKFENIPLSSWKKNVDWQLNSYFHVSQVVAGFMVKQSSGSIINIASIYGVVGPDFTVYEGTSMTMPAAYAVIKGGIVNYSRYLAAYLGPQKIRVNTISPGGIFNNQPVPFVEKYEKKVPLRRMGHPSDIAPGIVFLLSDEASYITGHNLIIDGGWTSI